MPDQAFIYGRMASTPQLGDPGRDQLLTCREYAARHGMTIVAEAVDAPGSGMSDRRPGFASLLAAVANGGIDVVLVTDLERVSRVPATIDYFLKLAARSMVRVVTTATPGRDAALLRAKPIRQRSGDR